MRRMQKNANKKQDIDVVSWVNQLLHLISTVHHEIEVAANRGLKECEYAGFQEGHIRLEGQW